MASIAPSGKAGAGAVRLDGWKSIAAHFGRDRTTVIRWTRERGLPVYRLPGGKSGTVYALTDELDRWAGLTRNEPPVVDNAHPAAPAPVSVARTRWSRPFGATLTVLGIGLPSALLLAAVNRAPPTGPAPIPVSKQNAPVLALPSDPAVARNFLLARDMTATRDALSLERAIALLEQVVVAAPRFAPGQSSLAEALLLSREFGMREDGLAFSQARSAARAAIRLAPELASGHRMAGFIAYWADGDIKEAEAAFAKALALAPDDALSHFWYGNILSDYGNHEYALKMLDHARLLQPGSIAIQTDLAWAQWSAGDDAAPVAALHEIVKRSPDFAVAHDCLAMIALTRGNFHAYLRHFSRYAELRHDNGLKQRAKALELAAREGIVALRHEILEQAAAQARAEPQRTQVIPALLASVAGEREQLKTILARATKSDERWGNTGFASRMKTAWRGDREIYGMLESRSRSSGSSTAGSKHGRGNSLNVGTIIGLALI